MIATETVTGPGAALIQDALDRANPDNGISLTEPETTTILSGDMLVEIDKNGEVVGVHGAPPETAATMQIVEYLGPRRLRQQAKIDGLVAEKARLIDEINAHYDPQIKQARGTLAWLDLKYREPLRALAAATLGKSAKSTIIGLLKLGFKASREKTDIVNQSAALTWARENCPQAVAEKTEYTVHVSKIPADLKARLTDDQVAETGIRFNEGGKPIFYIE